MKSIESNRIQKSLALVLFLAFISQRAIAGHSLQLQSSVGQNTSTFGLSYDGIENKNPDNPDPDQSRLNWNVNLTQTSQQQSATTAAGASQTLQDTTNSLSLGVGYQTRWLTGLNVNYAHTPEEKINSVGPDAYVGFKFYYGAGDGPTEEVRRPERLSEGAEEVTDENGEPEADPGPRPFRSYLTPKITIGSSLYSVDTNAKKATAADSITQTSSGLKLSWVPIDWIALRASFTGYKYNRDINKFTSRLNNNTKLPPQFGQFANSISSFPSMIATAGMTYSATDNFDIDLDYSWIRQAGDGTDSWNGKIVFGYTLQDQWHFGIGGEYDYTTSQQSGLALFEVGYDF